MDRRALLLAVGTAFFAGCTNSPSSETEIHDDTTSDDDNQTPTPTSTESAPGSVGQARVIGHWVEPPPDGATLFPTDEYPISDNDALQEVFDKAVEQDEWKGSEPHDETPEFNRGETVVEDVSDETMDEIVADLGAVDRYENSGRSGHYFDHDSTSIWITVESLDG